MAGKLCDNSIRAWAKLVRAESAVLAAVERDLKAAGFPPVAWYEVLSELARTPQHRLRPLELEARILLRQYNLSRLLDRMCAEKLVTRQRCPTDGRGLHIALESSGNALLKKMWPAYEQAICRHFAGKLGTGEPAQLEVLLEKLLVPAAD